MSSNLTDDKKQNETELNNSIKENEKILIKKVPTKKDLQKITFNSLIGNYNLPIILYNVLEKKFLCYEEFQWKFIDKFSFDDGRINEKCLISLLIDENNKVLIKGINKYLGYKPNYSTSDEKEAQLDIL